MTKSCTLLVLASLNVFAPGCGGRDDSKTQLARADTLGVVADTTRSTAPVVTSAESDKASSVRLLADSTSGSPRTESRDAHYIVHVPPAMLKVLYDSVPHFTPLAPEAYEPPVVTSAKDQDSDSLLSVLVADFDGDGLNDIAMIGGTRDSTSTVLVISNGKKSPAPRLFFLSRPVGAALPGQNYVFLTRPLLDNLPELEGKLPAVEVVFFGKAAVAYYIDHGVLRSMQTSD